ncbi:tetratricopeptide repeat protein [Candidatus Tisiphia endosymbiont of Myopa tessellatipennis]|uniref:tetratricopeptide repeat protein n=1 Tax=Candidatus Tisiphia endosymbiont of Myopa tessellatipennis TaxID=3066257 RepID=UPI00313DCBCD
MSYLSSKNKWLLVFDNLKIKENHKVQEFVNWEHNGHVIFASQDSELLPNTVKMTAFEKNDATTLANNILEKDDPKLAEFLVQEFSGYPILIVQGTQLLNQVPGLNQEEYKKRIRDSADKIKLNITLAIKELKPNTKRLLNKITLINTQGFSKELLKIITDDKNTIDDDIYQLSKFALVANIDSNETNPVFEMHDVIANKIIEINADNNNKNYLEDIVTKLIDATPKNLVKGRIFRSARTMLENLKIIERNATNYNINIYKLLELNTLLMVQYISSLDHYNAEKLFHWFNINDQQGKFKLWLMNNDEKYFYARYLGNSGVYYKNRFADLHKAFEYYSRAKEVFNKVKGYEASKCAAVYNLATFYIALGKITEAQNEINEMEQIFKTANVDLKEIESMLNLIKTKLYHNNGNEENALEEINKNIIRTFKSGISPKDLFFTNCYMLKSEILNSLGKYHEAYEQLQQLYEMHRSVNKEYQEIFARIFTQMSRAELGLGNTNKALEYAQKATTIFINDPSRANKNLTTSLDINLAKAFVAEGDALAALGQNEKAAESYAPDFRRFFDISCYKWH